MAIGMLNPSLILGRSHWDNEDLEIRTSQSLKSEWTTRGSEGHGGSGRTEKWNRQSSNLVVACER